MIKQYPTAPTAIALALLLTSVTVLAGCADTADNTQTNEDFEIRSMIAADRQQMQSMDERLRRLEGEIQDLAHNSQAPATISSAPAPPPAPAAAAPVTPPAQLGAPPAPGGPLPPNAVAPGGITVPPGAAANPAGEPAEAAANPGAPAEAQGAPESASAPGGAEGGIIASAPEASGDTAPSAEENTPENNGPPASAEEGGNDDNGNDQGAAESNPEAEPPEGENANAGEPAEGGAASSGEVIASMPPASAPENAPAAAPAARWPEDLARELQSTGNDNGGAGKVFRSGLQAMQTRNYSAAVDRFGYLQKKYPHSGLTEPAAYFSASALNEMGKYDQAILQYNDLVMRYPKGKYAGEAMLREAQDFVQINDKVDARLTLQKLINDYPGTSQAATANAMMKNLDSE